MLRWLVDLIQTPSAFRADPWGFTRNQIGHGYLIGLLGAMLLPWWAVIVPYIALEAWQNIRRGADLSDNIEDFANVAVMVMAAETGHYGYVIVHAIYLAAGIAWRVEERYRSAVRAPHRQAR